MTERVVERDPAFGKPLLAATSPALIILILLLMLMLLLLLLLLIPHSARHVSCPVQDGTFRQYGGRM